MKILHICPRFEPANGGAEDYIATISKWMAKNPKNEVELWTTDALEVDALWYPGKMKIDVLEEVIDGVKVKRFKTTPFFMNNLFINKAIRYILEHSPFTLTKIIGTPPTCFEMWAQIFRKDLPKYDIVHVQSFPYFSLLYIARAIAKKVGAKLYLTSLTHLGTDKKDKLRKRYFNPIGVQFYVSADKIFTLTNVERDEIISFVKERGFEIDKDKFETIGVGIFPKNVLIGNSSAFRDKYRLGNIPIVCSIGAKNYVKGTHTLIEAMQILWKRGVEVKLAIGGNNSIEFNEFWQKQSDLVKANTINLDMPSTQEKFDMLSASQIFCMISKSDSFGIVYLEAWINKIPVIGADIDIIHEIFEIGVDGEVTPFGDAMLLAQKIKYLLDNEELRKSMGEKGYNKVINNYTWDKIFNKLEKYFNE